MADKLPPFEPVSVYELRRIYANNRDPDVRRMTLEIMRYRHVLAELDGLADSIEQAWHRDVGGHMVAIYWLRQAIRREKFRAPPP